MQPGELLWNNLVSKLNICYGDIVLLIKVSELPNPSGIQTVLAETIGERQKQRDCIYVYVCLRKCSYHKHLTPPKGKKINLGKCGLRNIFPMEHKDSEWNSRLES